MIEDHKRSLDWLKQYEKAGFTVRWEPNAARLRDGGNATCELCGAIVDPVSGSFRSGARIEDKTAVPWVICTNCLRNEYT